MKLSIIGLLLFETLSFVQEKRAARDAKVMEKTDKVGVVMALSSPDGDEGYPRDRPISA